MTILQSHKEVIDASQKEVFLFLSDFNNFKALLPPQVEGWESSNESCRFTVKGLATISLKIDKKTPYSKIVVISENRSPIDFSLTYMIQEKSEENCFFLIEFSGEMNSFMEMMVRKPLQNFINELAFKLKEYYQK